MLMMLPVMMSVARGVISCPRKSTVENTPNAPMARQPRSDGRQDMCRGRARQATMLVPRLLATLAQGRAR